MKIKQTSVLVTLAVCLCGLFAAPVPVVRAATCNGVETALISCDNGDVGSCSDGSKPSNGTCKNEGLCSNEEHAVPDYTKAKGKECPGGSKVIKYVPPNKITDTGIWSLLIIFINIFTVGVGIAAVTGIVWGGAMFLTAAGNPAQFTKAKMIIWNTAIGIVVYAAMFAFMNYIIPGGLFSS